MFLPLGACFSIDRALSHETKQRQYGQYIGLPGLAILLQHAYLYSFGASLKSSVYAWQHATAIQEVMHMVHYRTAYAAYLLPFPLLMKWLTTFVYHIEYATILILFLPFYNAILRIVLFTLLTLMHIGFWIFLYLGYFPLISIAGLFLFLPSLFWEKAALFTDIRKRYRDARVYYDGDCEFCKKTCLLLREMSVLHHVPIVAAQDVPEIHTILRRENSWVVQDHHGKLLLRFDGVVYFWLHSPLFWPFGIFFKLPYLHLLGNHLYLLIAKHRGFLGKITSKALPYRQHAISPSWKISHYVVAICASITLYTNIRNIPVYHSLPYPTAFKSIMDFTQLRQGWGMFTEKNFYSMWVTSEGILTNGHVVDILYNHDFPPDSHKPMDGSQVFQGSRWEIPFLTYDWKKNGYLYAMAECRQWNTGTAKVLKRIRLTRYREYISHNPSNPFFPLEKNVLLDLPCW